MKMKKGLMSAVLILLVVLTFLPVATGETLKIGFNFALNWPLGIDALNTVQLDVELINKAGGLMIGGKPYEIELIVGDNKMDMGLSKTVAEKLIYKDKVKFMIGDGFSYSYLELADANKVVTLASPVTDDMCSPDFHYLFRAAPIFMWTSLISWTAEHYPDKKTILMTMPDRIDGRAYAPYWEKASKEAGLEVLETIFYPPTSVDHSSVGTRIKNLNPDILVPFGGGPQTDSLIIKAAHAAGYKGQVINTAGIPGGVMIGIAGPEAIEGMLSMAWPMEFDPALNPQAQTFKEAWIAKHGSYENPEAASSLPWWALKAALEKASKPEPDEVAEILASGLKFDSILGSGMTVARRDLNNPRTVDMAIDGYIKIIEGGKIKSLGKITAEEVYEFCAKTYGW